MKWRIYAYQRPSDGVEYVVSRTGSSIKFLLFDNWCSVEDSIDRVEEIIVEDIEELEKFKYRIQT